MSEQWTKGPWVIGDWGNDRPEGHFANCTLIESQYRIDKGLSGNDVAYTAPIMMDKQTEAEQLANSHLIAAAPDLYEALIAARNQLITLGGDPAAFTASDGDSVHAAVIEVVDMALARARGES